MNAPYDLDDSALDGVTGGSGPAQKQMLSSPNPGVGQQKIDVEALLTAFQDVAASGPTAKSGKVQTAQAAVQTLASQMAATGMTPETLGTKLSSMKGGAMDLATLANGLTQGLPNTGTPIKGSTPPAQGHPTGHLGDIGNMGGNPAASSQSEASSKQTEADSRVDEANAQQAQAAADIKAAATDSMNQMIHQIIDFVHDIQAIKSERMSALTRV